MAWEASNISLNSSRMHCWISNFHWIDYKTLKVSHVLSLLFGVVFNSVKYTSTTSRSCCNTYSLDFAFWTKSIWSLNYVLINGSSCWQLFLDLTKEDKRAFCWEHLTFEIKRMLCHSFKSSRLKVQGCELFLDGWLSNMSSKGRTFSFNSASSLSATTLTYKPLASIGFWLASWIWFNLRS